MFVLLGEQLPRIISNAAHVVETVGHERPMWLLVYVIAINLVLVILRFVWGWATLRLILFRATRRGKPLQKLSWRLIAVTAIAGVRGAVTLAGVLTLPLTLNDGSPFPGRELAIFLAAGVILVSLIVAGLGLPFLLAGLRLPLADSQWSEESEARVASARTAIRAVESHLLACGENNTDADLYAEAAGPIIDMYRRRIDSRTKIQAEVNSLRHLDIVERELWLVAIRAERGEFYRLSRLKRLSDEAARHLVRQIDLIETCFTA